MRAPLIAILVVGCGGGGRMVEEPAATAQPLPATELRLRGGGTWLSGDARGKVVVLDVWATYCAPCKRAFPKLGRLAAAFPDAAVIGISVDEDDAVVEAYLQTTPAAFTIARDPERHVELGPLAVKQLPTLIVVDREGRVRLRADLASEAVYDELPALVGRLSQE